MHDLKRAAQAYEAAAGHRDLRSQEADVFRYAIGTLKGARQGSRAQRARALADNRRLWLTVADLIRDPTNALPADLRASIVSLSLAVQREMAGPAPDFDFLIDINEKIAAGLSATP